jgi:hypothetical protein
MVVIHIRTLVIQLECVSDGQKAGSMRRVPRDIQPKAFAMYHLKVVSNHLGSTSIDFLNPSLGRAAMRWDCAKTSISFT